MSSSTTKTQISTPKPTPTATITTKPTTTKETNPPEPKLNNTSTSESSASKPEQGLEQEVCVCKTPHLSDCRKCDPWILIPRREDALRADLRLRKNLLLKKDWVAGVETDWGYVVRWSRCQGWICGGGFVGWCWEGREKVQLAVRCSSSENFKYNK